MQTDADDVNADSMSEFMSNTDVTEFLFAEEVMEDSDGGGEEETAKQRKADKDYAPSTTTQHCSVDGPQRCTLKLESSSAVASRYGMSHNEAACLCNAFLEDLGMQRPDTAIDSMRFFRERRDNRKTRREDRLACVKGMGKAVFFDEKINTTVFKETRTTTVETAKKGRGKRGATEIDELETLVQLAAREEHYPVIFFSPETYIRTFKLGED